MSNTPFFYLLGYLLLNFNQFPHLRNLNLLLYLSGYPFGETLYPRLHQCFFLGASCCSPNFCFSTLR